MGSQSRRYSFVFRARLYRVADLLSCPAAKAPAIPEGLTVPAETPFPHFLCIDFALCEDGFGRVEPQLIELQAFPTVACFQPLLTRAYPRHFEFPANFTSYFGGLDEASYLTLLRRAIVGGCDPTETVLLEITPDPP